MPLSRDVPCDAGDIAMQVRDTSASGIAAAITELVRSGDLEHGARLPTVRALGAELGVSPATVSAAWLMLRRRRIIATNRRGGTLVVGRPGAPHPNRFDSVGNFGDRLKTDLTFATPDPALLPDLSRALQSALTNESLNTYEREMITGRLADAVAPRWPFEAEAWHAVNGGYEGLMLLCLTSVGHGEAVAVEDPTAPRLLDILGVAGARVLPVRCDDEGPAPDDLERAVTSGAAAFIYQPRASSPRGHSVTEARLREMARVLEGTNAVVIEDDGLGEVATGPMHSLGTHFPDRTVLVRSFSKSHGPDLRVAVMGGASAPIELARAYRNFGARWTSRVLQDALAHLLADAECEAQVATARKTYAQRREALAEALTARNVSFLNHDGLSLWVAVEDEKYALITLAAHGMAVTPGSRFYYQDGPDHIRVATGQLSDGYEHVAECVALAAGPGSGRA
jgi:DNA-binding transcriptional MocR family regulator